MTPYDPIRSRLRAVALSVGLLALAIPSGSAVAEDLHPPVLELDLELSLADAAGDPGALFFWVHSDRGYYAVFASMNPRDPDRGSQLMAWDIETDRQAVLAPDINLLCGDEPQTGVPGHDLVDVVAMNERERIRSLIFGTAARGDSALDPAAFPGGCLLSFRIETRTLALAARLEPGWSVVRFGAHGAAALGVLARSHDHASYRLYRWDGQTLHATGVAGGPELRGITFDRDGRVVYQAPDGQVITYHLATPDEAPRPLVDPGIALKQRTDPAIRWLDDNATTIGPRNYQQTPILWGLNGATAIAIERSSTGAYSPVATRPQALSGPVVQQISLAAFARSLPEASSAAPQPAWRRGILYGVERTAEGVRLVGMHAASDRMVNMGLIRSGNGHAVQAVHALRTDNGGHVLLLAGTGSGLHFMRLRMPEIDSLLHHLHQARRERLDTGSETSVTFKVLDELARHGHEQDRNWDPLFTASDHAIYFGTMPHHPTRGSHLFRLAPTEGVLSVLGNIDALSANDGPHDVPNMIHLTPVELDGVLYWAGQDPFYGNRKFVSYTAETRHQGSPLLAYHLAEKRFEYLGRPLGTENIFGLLPAPTQKGLYLSQNYNNAIWHFYDLETREARRLDLPSMGKHQHVDSQGRLVYIDANLGEIMRFDPRGDLLASIGRITENHLLDSPPRQEGQGGYFGASFPCLDALGSDLAYACVGAGSAVVSIDTREGTVTPLGRLLAPEGMEGGFRALTRSQGMLYSVFHEERGERQVFLCTLDLESGRFINHGPLRDDHDRVVREVNAMAAGRDGEIYLNASVWSREGDRGYSTRFAVHEGQYHNNVIGRLDRRFTRSTPSGHPLRRTR